MKTLPIVSIAVASLYATAPAGAQTLKRIGRDSVGVRETFYNLGNGVVRVSGLDGARRDVTVGSWTSVDWRHDLDKVIPPSTSEPNSEVVFTVPTGSSTNAVIVDYPVDLTSAVQTSFSITGYIAPLLYSDLNGAGEEIVVKYATSIGVYDYQHRSYTTWNTGAYSDVLFANLDGDVGNEIVVVAGAQLKVIDLLIGAMRTYSLPSGWTSYEIAQTDAGTAMEAVFFAPSSRTVTVIHDVTGAVSTYTVPFAYTTHSIWNADNLDGAEIWCDDGSTHYGIKDRSGLQYELQYDAVNKAPTVAVAPWTNPDHSWRKWNLSVTGASVWGETRLFYTWALTGTNPGTATFSANGTNAARNTVATVSAPGTYHFLVTLRDPAGSVNSTPITIDVKAEL